MMTKEEYEKTYIRMMDSVRTDCKGNEDCIGVSCYDCPIQSFCGCDNFTAFAIIELVEKWGKEHPIGTNADKFEEVFGRRPQNRDGTYLCPQREECLVNCEDCKIDYWESEYVTPKKERKEE